MSINKVRSSQLSNDYYFNSHFIVECKTIGFVNNSSIGHEMHKK